MASILLQTFSSIHFTKPFVAVSSAPTKMGITVTLMFQFFFFRTLPFTLLNQIWTFDLRVIIRWNFKVSEKLYYFLFSQSTWRWVLTFGWLRKSKPFVQFQIFSADRLSFLFFFMSSTFESNVQNHFYSSGILLFFFHFLLLNLLSAFQNVGRVLLQIPDKFV